MAKNPQRPPRPLRTESQDIVRFRAPLWRVHTIIGPHALAWDELRMFGPAATMRWDPHPPPPGPHLTVGVSYAATDVSTAFAEVFQRRRAIIVSPDRAVAGWIPRRALRLLDLSGDWPLRNGASASLHAAPKSTCRAWAAAIHQQIPDVDGLTAPSTMTGRPMVVLFSPAADSFPSRPAFSRMLSDPAAEDIINASAQNLGWSVSA